MKKTIIVLALCMVILGGVFVYSAEDKNDLTSSQIDKMIQLGIIQVNQNLPNNFNDKNLNMIYNTQNGECSLYQDIFGRYYCRW